MTSLHAQNINNVKANKRGTHNKKHRFDQGDILLKGRDWMLLIFPS